MFCIYILTNQEWLWQDACRRKIVRETRSFFTASQFIRHWGQYILFWLCFFFFQNIHCGVWRLVWIKNVCMLAENLNILKASIKNVRVLVGICNILKLKIKPAFPFTTSGPLDISSSIRGRLVMTILIFSMIAWHIGSISFSADNNCKPWFSTCHSSSSVCSFSCLWLCKWLPKYISIIMV